MTNGHTGTFATDGGFLNTSGGYALKWSDPGIADWSVDPNQVGNGSWWDNHKHLVPQQEQAVSKKIKKGTHLVVRKSDGLVVAIEDNYTDALEEARDRAVADEAEFIVFSAKKSVRPKRDDLEEQDA